MKALSGKLSRSDGEKTRGFPVLKTYPDADPSSVLSVAIGTFERSQKSSGESHT
jgi:hypothetical protein